MLTLEDFQIPDAGDCMGQTGPHAGTRPTGCRLV